MRQELSQIVTDYGAGIAKTLALLEKKFGKVNYTLAKNEERIPKRGFLDEAGNIPYNLHGAGITAYVGGVDVTFDFAPLIKNHIGLDAWHLAMFTKMNRETYPDFADVRLDDLERQFGELLAGMGRRGLLEFNVSTGRYYPKGEL
jgi:hypothetical protein